MQAKTLKALSLLLHYPDQALLDHLADLRAVTDAETTIGDGRLAAFYQYLGQSDLYLLEENYVALFDRGRGTSLYLFEHVHGESRDRGQAMVDLLALYGDSGFVLSAGELPDYLPVFLEYLAQLEVPRAQELLGEVTHLVRNIGENLAKRGSHYYLLCAALLDMAGAAAIKVDFVPMDFSTDQEDYDRLDKDWAEAPVTFGGGCASPDGGQSGESIMQFVPRSDQQKLAAGETLGA